MPPRAPEAKPVDPGLYLVATPIGNLRDITLRALDVLAAADLVLAEDTRVSGKLLAAYGIVARLQRYDEHAGAKVRPRILAALLEGARVALVSDAGTPLISDPGYRLVIEALAQGSAVHPIPGPSAALAALTVAGLPTDRFVFAGFPPARASARRAFLEDLASIRATLIIYESGPRLADSLKAMADVFGPRPTAVARELTKLHETVVRGPLDALAAEPRLAAPKGEIVVVVAGPEDQLPSAEETESALVDALRRLPPGAAAAEVSKALGLPRRELYAQALAISGRQ
jgi:16S rRNA (cytidine1402-2'-O)-methyltransferase